MTDGISNPVPEAEREPTVEEIAFRPGTPDEWGQPERSYQVSDRVCGVLGLTHYTEEIKKVGFTESDRQTEIFTEWQRGVKTKIENQKYRERMGGVALKLVDALVPADDPRDREVLVDGVLEALRLIDKRLERVEWDGVVGRP